MKPTIKDIHVALESLEKAMIASLEADVAEEDAKLKKQKAHYDLLRARDEVRNINFY